MKRNPMGFATVLLLAVAACSGGSDSSGGTAQDTAQGSGPVARVGLATAQTGTIVQTVTIYGEVERADSQMALVAPAEAVVVAVAAPAGAKVGAGQVIARLRPSPAGVAQYQAAAADAAAAAEALARAGRLRADGLASDADVEAARARHTAAAALLASLGERRDALILRTPHAGFVDSVAASVGDLLQPGAMVATVSRSGAAKGRFGIDPALARRLAAGAAIVVHPADGSPPFTAAVASVSPVTSAQSRLASILVAIPAGSGLAAGLPLSGELTLRADHGAVSVPYAALLDDGGQPFVFVVQGGVARRRDVVLGASDSSRAAIVHGVAAGDTVIIAGGTGVQDGMNVRSR